MEFNKKLWIQINNTLRKRDIDPSQSKFINTVRHHDTETFKHFLAKAKKCFSLYKNGHPYISEAWTRNHSRRFDTIDLIDNIVYEFETKNIDKNDGSVRVGI
jgi:hypothetical protein